VVLPPTAEVGPVWPKRNLYLTGVWIAAIAVGAAVAYALHSLRPVVSSVSGMNALTKFPVLGVVGVAFPSRERVAFRRHFWSFSAAATGLIVAYAVVLLLNWWGVRFGLKALHALVRT
jgi:hypothetical protein